MTRLTPATHARIRALAAGSVPATIAMLNVVHDSDHGVDWLDVAEASGMSGEALATAYQAHRQDVTAFATAVWVQALRARRQRARAAA